MDATKKKTDVHSAAPDEPARKPLKRFTDGSVSVAVFGNEREVKGAVRTFYNVSVSRSYEKDGRYHVLFENDSLGSYATPAQAADDLSGGHTDSVQSGIDTSTLGISDDIADWDRL